MFVFGDKFNTAYIDTSKKLIMKMSCHWLEATHIAWIENSNATTGIEIEF